MKGRGWIITPFGKRELGEMALTNNEEARLGSLASTTAGLGCILAWTYIVFFSRLVHYSTRNDIAHLNSTYTFACCGIVATLLICAAVVGLCSRRMPHPTDPGRCRARWILRLPPMASAVLCIATVVLTMVERRVFTQPWCSITSTLSGCAVAILLLAWAWGLLCFRKASLAVGCLTSSFVFGAVVFVAVLYLPTAAAIAVCALLPPLSAALFRVACRKPNHDECPLTQSAQAPLTAHCSEAGSTSWGALIRTFICIGLLGLVESFMRALFLTVDPASSPVAYRWLFLLATVLSAATLALAASKATKSAAVRITCRTSMCVLVFLTLLTPIVSDLGLAADLTTLVCYCMFSMLAWLYLTLTARAYPVSVIELFGLGLGASYLGCLAGTFFGGVFVSFCAPSYRALSFIALLCAGAILAALLFIADEQVFARLIDADDDRPQAPRRFMLRVQQVAQEYGLTPKETEVFTLAAKGRTTQRIREELGLSTGTVNTHLAHIYKKLDVHDRQQMLDLVEGKEE